MSVVGRWSTHEARDVRLESGAVLPRLATAYATLGRRDARGSNAVLVLHGYTTGPSMLFPGSNAAEGSWSGLIGPGRAIDTDRYFVICPNMLGSCYGSTGPGSVDPGTGRPYGMDFPSITIGDIVAAQVRLVDSLGIGVLAAVAGPSLGAMQAFTWATRHPERVARVVAAVGAPYRPAAAVRADDVVARLARDPAWRDGRYDPKSLVPCLMQMRMATLERYGIEAELMTDFPDAGARRREVERLAGEWAREFDPGVLVVLARAIAAFDVRPDLPLMRAPLLYVLSRSDDTFPPMLAHELAPLFDAAQLPWTYIELDSDKGHLASGADSALWAGVLADFMTTSPEQWRRTGLGAHADR
jgi:homoserine O-acetyltransferase/O-succinyltransferase